METTLTFLKDLPLYNEEKPYRFVGFPKLPAQWQSNCEYVDEDHIMLHNVRSDMSKFSLNGAGFTFRRHHSLCTLDADRFVSQDKDHANLKDYLEETIDFVKAELNEERVICFDWRIRKNTDHVASIPAKDSDNFRHYAIPPASNIHCDFSRQGGWDRLAMHLSEQELAEVKNDLWHVQFINVWRPLQTVKNAPLVLCDRRTVEPGDLREVDKVLPEKVEYTLYMLHRKYHRWYWLPEQRPEEVTIFVTWDSRKHETCADMPPHGAGLHVRDDHSAPRESIEVRLLVMRKA